ncbi:C-X-C chemokine receptor type 1-like [Conger conger]|nr:C-X-C chemokine receptor type 1-like [Conger conger]
MVIIPMVKEDDFSDYNHTYYEMYPAPCEPDSPVLIKGLLVTIYSVVFLLSLLGNTVVLYVAWSMESRRTSTDTYLMHLALADLLFSLTLPFWAVFIHSEWIFGTFLCKLLAGLQEATFYSGVLLLACISVDRYLAIVKATQAISQRRRLVAVVCGVVWVLAGLLSLPVLVQWEAFQPGNQDGLVCHKNLQAEDMARWRLGLRLLHHIVGFFVPLAVMLFCYGFTAVTLLRGRTAQRHRAMHVILWVVLAFVGCWLPNNVAILTDTLLRARWVEETCTFRSQLDFTLKVTQVLAFLHCAINPILYAFIGHRFRSQLFTTLFNHGLFRNTVLSKYRHSSVRTSTSCNISTV